MAHWSCGVFVQLLWRTATSKEALNQICLNFAQIVSAVTKTLHLPHGKSEFARTSARFVPMVVRRYCTMYAQIAVADLCQDRYGQEPNAVKDSASLISQPLQSAFI